MARGNLFVLDIATWGQIGPANALVASLMGYFISGTDAKALVYRGKVSATGVGVDRTYLSSRTALASKVMEYNLRMSMDTPGAGNFITLMMGLRGDINNGYTIEFTSNGSPTSNTVLSIVKYSNGVKNVLATGADLFATFTTTDFVVDILDTPLGVSITVSVGTMVLLSFTDGYGAAIPVGGNMWLEFDSDDQIVADANAIIFIYQITVSLASETRRDPMAMLRWSDDGGNTWTKERWESFGGLGEYLTRVKWNALGASRDRVFRFTVSDPVKVVLVNSDLRLNGQNVQN